MNRCLQTQPVRPPERRHRPARGSGLDEIRGVRERAGPGLPAIALGGSGMGSDRRQARQAGSSAHPTRPIDIQQVEAAIRSVVAEAAAPRGAGYP